MLRILLAASLVLAGLPASAKTKYTKITIEVRNEKDEPVDRAAVIVKPMKGKNVQRAYELRTSQQGTAPLPPLRQGKFLVQVIAKGYQTFGETYDVREDQKIIPIKLNQPQGQFSVHK